MNTKYYNLYIDFNPNWETHHKISAILGVEPLNHKTTVFDTNESPNLWHYQVIEKEGDSPFAFIPEFIKLLRPNFEKLKEISIQKENILISLVYEYQHQCAMNFTPEEMNLLGQYNINLNIDCHQIG